MNTPLKAPRIACICILGAAAFTAHAQTFPTRNVTVIVPYPAGGTADMAGRLVAQAMAPHLGQAVVVDNRAGAGGNIGMGVLARADADGYTLGLGTIGTQTINQFLYADMPFAPEKDFTPIAMVLTTPNVIAVKADSDMTSVQDLIAKAKAATQASPSYASPGIGSSVHLSGAYLEQAAGVQMLHVPFKGVSGSMPALIGGQVDVLMDNLPSTLSHLRDGSRVRALAVTSAERSPSLPDVPTVAESGLPGFDVNAWFAIYAPAGLPADVQDTLVKAARAALAEPSVQKQLADLGASPGTLFGSELAAYETQERERWGQLVAERKISAQ